MNATCGEKANAATSASSAPSIAARYMLMTSQMNMPTMMATRTSNARRRSFIHAPTVYSATNIAMFPA